MKRKTVKALFCAALMALTLSATACGASGDENKSSNAAVIETSVDDEAPAEEEVSGDGATLEDYLKSDAEAEKQLEEQAQAMGNEQMDMTIEVNGNDIVYVATLKEEIENSDELAEAVNEQVGPAFSALAGAMDEVVGVEKGTVSFGIRYCAPDGTVLAEASFRAE